jgi:hypothetical protein
MVPETATTQASWVNYRHCIICLLTGVGENNKLLTGTLNAKILGLPLLVWLVLFIVRRILER